MDRAENAYLYSNAKAAAEAYRVAGNTAKADEMDAFAQNIKEQVLDVPVEPRRATSLEHAHGRQRRARARGRRSTTTTRSRSA